MFRKETNEQYNKRMEEQRIRYEKAIEPYRVQLERQNRAIEGVMKHLEKIATNLDKMWIPLYNIGIHPQLGLLTENEVKLIKVYRNMHSWKEGEEI